MTPSAVNVPQTAVAVRHRLERVLERDLVGPDHGHPHAEEMLPGWQRPSNWYLTGFLVPVSAGPEESSDADSDEEIDAAPETEAATDDAGTERTTGRRNYFPSSIGLSTLVPADAIELTVSVRWGDYALTPWPERDGDPSPEEGPRARTRSAKVWRRIPREQEVMVPLGGLQDRSEPISVPDSDGLELHVLMRSLDRLEADAGLPTSTHAVSLFLVNDRAPDDGNRDLAYAFQPQLEVSCAAGFVGRPDLRPAGGDWDEQVATLHYADTPEFATGHGISADWELQDAECRIVRTRWVPVADVEQTIPATIDRVTLSMDALGELRDEAAVTAALTPLVEEYRRWIEARRDQIGALTGESRRDGGAAVAQRRVRGDPDRAWDRGAPRGRRRTRRVPSGQPRDRAGRCDTVTGSASRRGGRSRSRSSSSTSPGSPDPTTPNERSSTSSTSRPAAARRRRT